MFSKLFFGFVFLSSTAASAAVYTFDYTRRECVNASGQVGKNAELGVCSDQSGADLNSAQLSGRVLTGSDFSLASLSKAQLDNAQLEYVLLNSAYLDAARLNYAKLTGAKAENAVFDGAILADADLRQALLSSASFVSASLEFAIFNEADLSFATMTQADMSNARLRKAKLRDAKLIEVKAESADFQGVSAAGANFSRAFLEAASFRDADLSKAVFQDADVNQVDFRNAVLKGANLKARNLDKADLRGARFDSFTQLPFSSSEARTLGMIYDPSSPAQNGGTKAGESAWKNPAGQGGDGKFIITKDGRLYQQLTTTSTTVISRLDTAKGSLTWSYTYPGYARELLADCVDQDKLFIASNETVIALDSLSGKVLWTADLPNAAVSSSELKCSQERKRIVLTQNAYGAGFTLFSALNKDSGAVAWQFESRSLSQLKGYDELNAYLESTDSSSALSMQNGSQRWQLSPKTELKPNGRHYQWDSVGLKFIDSMTGKARWSHPTTARPWNTTFSMNHVLLQSENSITQLDADSGRVLWTFDLSPFQGLHVYASQWSANRVSIGLRNQLENWTRYIVLDAMSGRQLWEKTVDSYYASFSPTDEQGFIFASPGSLNLLDPDTGRVRWTIDPTPYTKDLSSPMFNVIAVQNGKIHFQVFDNPPSRYPSLRLLTLSEADGSFLWQKAYFAASRLAGTNDDFIFVSKTNPSGPATAEDTFLEALVK